MREIIFDTETTGLDSREDRIIEIGCIELVNRFPTGRTWHHYINAQGRAVHPDAFGVHGISDADLVGKPVFAGIIDDFLEFTDGAKLVAHNANFDIGFINAELKRLEQLSIEQDRVIDTLALARRKHPMGPNSLDALCRRYGIDNSRRTKHGALLDAELLAEVYIELVGGKQASFGLEISNTETKNDADGVQIVIELPQRPRPLVSRITAVEREAHQAMVTGMGPKALWVKFEQSDDDVKIGQA